MKYITGIIASTHVDLHGDRFSIEALKSLVDQANSQYIPSILEHDPRVPPLGRVVSARLTQLEDGNYGVEIQTQIFEPGDDIELDNSGRKMPMSRISDEYLHLIDDRSFYIPEDQSLLEELIVIMSGKKERAEKKALLPISVLEIGGAFVAGGIFTGLFNKIGADCWDSFKKKVSSVIEKKRKDRGQCLFTFRSVINQEPTPISLEVILTNPSESDIDNFLEYGIKELDRIAPQLLSVSPNVSRIVFEYAKNKLTISFGVRTDAVPVYWEQENKSDKTGK